MSLVDDSLLSTAPVRASKSSGKSGGSSAAGSLAAFENAFADAGRKKQGDKGAADDSVSSSRLALRTSTPQAQVLQAQALQEESQQEKTTTPEHEADAPQRLQTKDMKAETLPTFQTRVSDTQSFQAKSLQRKPLQAQAQQAQTLQTQSQTVQEQMKADASEDLGMLRAVAEGGRVRDLALPPLRTATAAPVSDKPILDPVALEKQLSELVKRQKTVGPAQDTPSSEKIVSGETTADAPDTGDASATAGRRDLAEDRKLDSDRMTDRARNRAIDAKAATPPVADAGEAAAVSGGVNQLLALLAPAQEPHAAGVDTPASSPLLSEFQALADRAGKARADQKTAVATPVAREPVADANAVRNATAASEADQVFRFARADGKGQAVSMTISSDADKPAAKVETASAAPSAKAETVTVLEARRYLGLASTTNAAAVTGAIAGSAEWARSLQPSAALSSPEANTAAGTVLNTLKIQMHPIELGLVTATLRLKDDELHVELKVETGEAFRQLNGDQNDMVKALRAQGFAVDQVSVVYTAGGDASGSNAGTQQQPQAGQQGREASGDGSAQGRGRNEGNGSEARPGGRWSGNEGTDEASAVAELGRAGDVYM